MRKEPASSLSWSRTQRDRNRRVLSQNFLRSGRTVEEYLATVDVEPTDLVLEVGAGEGVITGPLARRCREVYAYEIDPNLLPRLRDRLRDAGNVHVVQGDFLATRPPRERFKVVGNVPFSITSQVVHWCLQASTLNSATIITQLEFAKKRTGAYGRWSLLTVKSWPEFHWELRARIPKDRFRPVPRVDAGVLRLVQRDRPLVRPALMPEYWRLVEAGFSGVGGSLYRSLIRHYPRGKVDVAFRTVYLDRGVVVAFVTPEQWLGIFDALYR